MGLLAFLKSISAHPEADYCLRLLVALLCGAALGLERTFRSKEAGIRTHSILAGGAALFMIISKYAFFDIGNAAWSQGFDPTLIAGFIIDGSGFLCAGTIFSKAYRDSISGMTTAAGIWATAAMGMACGAGMLPLAIAYTLFLLLGHLLLARRGYLTTPVRTLRLTIENTPRIREILRHARDTYGIQVISARYSHSSDENTVSMLIKFRSDKSISFEDTFRFLDNYEEVKDISF